MMAPAPASLPEGALLRLDTTTLTTGVMTASVPHKRRKARLTRATMNGTNHLKLSYYGNGPSQSDGDCQYRKFHEMELPPFAAEATILLTNR